MDLINRANIITSRKRSPYKAGTIDKIFEYHSKMQLNYLGKPYVFIKPDPNTKKNTLSW